MRKIATFAAGTALAAGVVLVPAAGFAGAATAHTVATTHSKSTTAPVTQVHPRDVSVWECDAAGGAVVEDWNSPSGYVCVGGWVNGEIVWW